MVQTFTVAELLAVARQFKAYQLGLIELFDVKMPNGKRLGDCTGGYVAAWGEACQMLGKENDTREIADVYPLDHTVSVEDGVS